MSVAFSTLFLFPTYYIVCLSTSAIFESFMVQGKGGRMSELKVNSNGMFNTINLSRQSTDCEFEL